jgi:DeoR/GlpR family transcriptional regulator of sugar metabolism
LAKKLLKRNFIDLGIITNSPAIQQEALDYPDYRVISTGGELRQNFNMFAGSWVVEFLRNLNMDSAFISAAGISPAMNITTSNPELAEILRVVFQRADEVNLLIDSSKIYKSALLNIEPIDKCSRIIADRDFDDKLKRDIEKLGCVELVV